MKYIFYEIIKLLSFLVFTLNIFSCSNQKHHTNEEAVSSSYFDTCESEILNLRMHSVSNDFAYGYHGSLEKYCDSVIYPFDDSNLMTSAQGNDSTINFELSKMSNGCDIEIGFEIGKRNNSILDNSSVLNLHRNSKAGKISRLNNFIIVNSILYGYEWTGYEKKDTVAGSIKCVITDDFKYMKLLFDAFGSKSVFLLRIEGLNNSLNKKQNEVIKLLKSVSFDF